MWLAVPAALALIAIACVNPSEPEGWAGPLLQDDTLFVSIDRGEMAALDGDDLSLRWIFPPDTEAGRRIDLEAIYSTPVVSGGTVYFAAYDGNVYALNAEDGSVGWPFFETDGPIIGGLTLVDGTVFVGSDDGRLYALDAASGDQLDSFDTGDSIWATPLVANGVVYVPSLNGKLYALDARSLERLWERPFEADAGLITDPVLADEDTLLVGGIDRTLYALDPATGEERWSFEADNWFWGRPLVADGTVYVPNLDSQVYALELATGEMSWSFEAEEPVRSSPLLVGDVLVLVDRRGNVYGLDPATGSRKWGPEILDKTVLSDPILWQERVLIVAQGGDLYSVDPSGGARSLLEVRQP